MKAVARLVWSYFTGTPPLRAFTIGGLILLAVDFYFMVTQATQAQSGEKLWVAILGIIFLFTGSLLMPVMVGRLARSHSIGVLPGGRLKLLLSAFLTILLVALPVGILSPASLISANASIPEIMKDPRARDFILEVAALTFTSAVLFAGWMYLALWLLISQRNAAGLFKGLLVMMLVIFAPAKDISDFTVSLTWNLQQIAVIWAVFGAGFLLWPRFKAARSRGNREWFAGFARMRSGNTAGREFDLLLGTSNPWLLIAGLALPLFIATRFVREAPSVLLFFLTILSVVTGAYSGQAAERSRALWLRGDWSRTALFSAVERSVWRHNGIVLGVLMLFTVGIGLYASLSPALLTAGLVLLALGTVLSTCLGLMVTRGLRWPEIVSGIAVMWLLMILALLIADAASDLALVCAFEFGLAVFAIVLRLAARRRWAQIDWTMCRPDRALSTRGA